MCKCAHMNRRLSARSLFTVASAFAVSLLVGSSGCDKTDPPIPDDGNDLSVKPADLSHGHTNDMAMNGADMATSGGDMAVGAADMTSTGPKVTGLPSCTDTGVTADAVFNAVAKTSCAMGRCHSTGAGYLPFTDGATMKSAMVGKKSGQSMLNVVTAGNVDQSYLIYKLMDQHLAMGVGGKGELMPKGGTKLPNADLCKFIVWVKEGGK